MSAHKGGKPPHPTPKREWRLDSDGAWRGRGISHRGPWETGLLEECGQGVGLWGRDENSFQEVPRPPAPITAGLSQPAPPSVACAHLSAADTHVAGVSSSPLREGKHFLRAWRGKREPCGQKRGHICLDDNPRTKAQSGAFQEGPALLPWPQAGPCLEEEEAGCRV